MSKGTPHDDHDKSLEDTVPGEDYGPPLEDVARSSRPGLLRQVGTKLRDFFAWLGRPFAAIFAKVDAWFAALKRRAVKYIRRNPITAIGAAVVALAVLVAVEVFSSPKSVIWLLAIPAGVLLRFLTSNSIYDLSAPSSGRKDRETSRPVESDGDDDELPSIRIESEESVVMTPRPGNRPDRIESRGIVNPSPQAEQCDEPFEKQASARLPRPGFPKSPRRDEDYSTNVALPHPGVAPPFLPQFWEVEDTLPPVTRPAEESSGDGRRLNVWLPDATLPLMVNVRVALNVDIGPPRGESIGGGPAPHIDWEGAESVDLIIAVFAADVNVSPPSYRVTLPRVGKSNDAMFHITPRRRGTIELYVDVLRPGDCALIEEYGVPLEVTEAGVVQTA